MKLLFIGVFAIGICATFGNIDDEDVKIVGGEVAYSGQFPHQISFRKDGQGYTDFHFCGGSIYSKTVIITAGHCVQGEKFDGPTGLSIVAGEYDLEIDEGTEQRRTVIQIIQHELYDDKNIDYDIALLILDSPLVFDTYVAAVPLPAQDDDILAGDNSTVSGWGTLSNDTSPDQLWFVDVPVISTVKCKAENGFEAVNADTMICAGANGTDSCQGDSGGPLVGFSMSTNNIVAQQFGIVSWGFGCGLPLHQGVYTKLSAFIGWMFTNGGVAGPYVPDVV